jgi:hypothetical protein
MPPSPGSSRRWISRRQTAYELLLTVMSCVIAVSIGELVLRMLTPYPISETSHQIPHPRLAYTMDPDTDDIDPSGFRNVMTSMSEAEIAVIGDSHAYGFNVSIDDDYPTLLARLGNLRVYNFGVGSYGIYQYKVLLDELIGYNLSAIVVSLYIANDLTYHCASMQTNYWRQYMASRDLQRPSCNRSWSLLPLMRKAIERTAIYQILANIIGPYWQSNYFLFADGQRVSRSLVIDHSRATDLSGDCRPDSAQSINNICINFKNSKRFFVEAARDYDQRHIGFVVLLVPSKELVLYNWATATGQQIDPDFQDLMRNQIEITGKYKQFFDQHGIAYVDALPTVLDAFLRARGRGEEFYPLDDGHPLRSGYEAYAEATLRGLRRLGVTPPQ